MDVMLTLGSRVVGAVHDGSDGETKGHSELGTGGSGCKVSCGSKDFDVRGRQQICATMVDSNAESAILFSPQSLLAVSNSDGDLLAPSTPAACT